MATNPFFNTMGFANEQRLMESLVTENITLTGIDMIYIVRDANDVDRILGEARNSSFSRTYEIEMSVVTVDNFEGDGDIMAKFGFQIKDNMVLAVSNSRFEELVGQTEEFVRPREGDLVYFPLNDKLWEIRHVEHEKVFYAFGKLYSCELKLELFSHSNEYFNTGIQRIDEIYQRHDYSEATIDTIEDIDTGASNLAIETEAATYIDFSENNPFGSDTH